MTSEVHRSNSSLNDLPEHYAWIYHQNLFLKRSLELKTVHDSQRADLWSEIEALIDDLSVSTGPTQLHDDMRRRVKHIKSKMKKNFELQIEIENQCRLDPELVSKWSQQIPEYVRGDNRTLNAEANRTENRLLARIEYMEVKESAAHKEIQKLARNVDTLQGEYVKLKSSFSAASCISFLDTFQKYIQLIKADIKKLTRK